MYIDAELLFSDKQDLAQAAGTYLSENVIDLRQAGTPPQGSLIHDVGRGTPIQLFGIINETFTSLGAGTLQVQLVNAANEALSVSATVLQQTPALALATLVKGYQFRFSTLPVGLSEQYLGLKFVIATATMDTGTVTFALVSDRQANPGV